MKKILFLFGTRPEAIKMAPLIKVFSQDSDFDVRVGVTAQHREMLDQVLDFFKIDIHYDLNIMMPNQTLHDLTAGLISRITNEILLKEKFDLVFVQGDTTTVLASALAAFYQKIKIAHIEAGLRSHDMQSPFPEEMNRVITSRLADFHFCPTENSRDNLIKENTANDVYVVGNTVIDALLEGLAITKQNGDEPLSEKFSFIDFTKKIILVTCHRRENFGEPFLDICNALLEIADEYADVEIVYPVHLNPNIKEIAHSTLKRDNIKLIHPLDYNELIWMMDKSTIILTDSGGIQEEAPSLGKPVLVLREVTERMEGVDAGTALLVGHNKTTITDETARLLNDTVYYSKIATAINPYGDGTTALKIKNIISATL
ncbi:UDP-N-acetylglucosamine 2-epimerase (non-hydrolyzing) [Flavobacterium sp. DG1-102-2]|uniref:non-hydrolyzing UDP-N-acetylglucosamine 2-epimerase n=1 Tax=Flavobacterium sp. DG1-102-2 TaxID=3081663 RepID=UPI00294A2409|nr:UDP-N-acetylglucosamine 2-epimerase (non-hydrolyzing) [Flavobacterium sp. DG1-102-2]MDV6167728.1 UDP-N-acetylglucosamine 2-epimerase (non-hydrolyzing) [Flavobacterium sp. DG1-102-2]